MFGLSFTEIMIIAAVALIAVGPKKLPGVARAVGRGFTEFKGALDEMRTTVYKEVQEPLKEAKSTYIDNLLLEREKVDGRLQSSGPPPEVEVDLGPYQKEGDEASQKVEARPPPPRPKSVETDGKSKNSAEPEEVEAVEDGASVNDVEKNINNNSEAED
jgi:TatA/E family protein of Tat protein translocase